MITTKEEYIQMNPRTKLAKQLLDNDWPVNQRIEIVNGLESPDKSHAKSNGSNLFKALIRNKQTEYVKGGKLPGINSGFVFAVKAVE